MPFHLNKVSLAGTMTRDPELKYTPKGTAVIQVSIAINRVWYNDNDEKQEETVFVEVEAWGAKAEVIGKHCAKGHTVYFEGRLKMDSWDDKTTGQKRTKMKVVAEEFKFVSSPRKEGEGQQQTQQQRKPAQPPQRRPADPDLDAAEDDIPF